MASLEPDKTTPITSPKEILYSFGRGRSPVATIDVGLVEIKL